MKLLRIFSRFSSRNKVEEKETKNHTLETISLFAWIKVAEGELRYIALDEQENKESRNAWYMMQDEYIALFGGDSSDMKKYKYICFTYLQLLCEWVQNPVFIGSIVTELNEMFAEKEALQKKVFKDETDKMDLGEMVAKVSISVQYHIDSKKMSAKEFFNIVKALNNGKGE